MSSIDIFQLREMFAGARSMAIVGNSSSITEFHNGPLIDRHDIVVRFNRARVAGLEDRIGARTDILATNDLNSLEKAPSPAETIKPKCVVTFSLPKREKEISDLRAWVGETPHCLTYSPDILGVQNYGSRVRSYTTGTYALYSFLRIWPIEKLLLTGFTMFGQGAGGQGKYYETERHDSRYAGIWHDLDEEGKVFAQIVGGFAGELTVTSEVHSLLARYGWKQTPANPVSANPTLGNPTPDSQLYRIDSRHASVKVPLYRRVMNRIGSRLVRLGMKLRRLSEFDRTSWLKSDNDIR